MRQGPSAAGATPRARARCSGSADSGSSRSSRRLEMRSGMRAPACGFAAPPCEPLTRKRGNGRSIAPEDVRDADPLELLAQELGGVLADLLEPLVQRVVIVPITDRRLAADGAVHRFHDLQEGDLVGGLGQPIAAVRALGADEL